MTRCPACGGDITRVMGFLACLDCDYDEIPDTGFWSLPEEEEGSRE